MKAQPQKKTRMIPEEYLEFDSTTDIKYEYFDGEIFAMTGASLNHNQISMNVAGELRSQLKRSPCRPFANDMRVKIESEGGYAYPDLVAVCGNIEMEKIKGVETLLNPTVIIEILSDSTEAFDRGDKFAYYRAIPTIQDYILVSQNKCRIEQFTRKKGRTWKMVYYDDIGQSIQIESISCDVPLSEIYWDVEFEDKK